MSRHDLAGDPDIVADDAHGAPSSSATTAHAAVPAQRDVPARGAGPAAATTTADKRVRRPVAVLLSRFPRITETFILREIDEMERQGQPVRLVPLLRESADVIHAEAISWVERALFTPFLSAEIIASNVRMLTRRPRPYLRTLAGLVRGTASSGNFLVRTLALFPKAVHLAERLEREEIHHLHAHFATHPATVALIISELTEIGFSFTAHAHDIFVRQQLLGAKLETADFVRVISDFNRDFLAERYPDQAGKIDVIRVGIDIDAYPAGDESASPARPSDVPLLLAVAALEPYKGLHHLVEACGLLRHRGIAFRCDIVGAGSLRRELEELIEKLDLEDHVRLRGALPQHDVAALLARARVFVLPSVVADDGQMEGLPVALMEAMASDCPVVATRLSGVPELVEDGTSGLLTRPGDPADLAGAVAEILGNARRARALAAVGRRAVATQHRIEPNVARLIERIDAFNDPAPRDFSRLLESLDWPGGEVPEAIGLRRLRERPDSRVAELMTVRRGAIDIVVVKQHRGRAGQSRPPRERARREHELLHRLHGVRLGVPRPLAFDERHAAILMERCPGRSFASLLQQWRFRRGGGDMLVGATRRAGRWLRHFQQLTTPAAPVRGAGPLIEVLMERASGDVERCRRAGVLRFGDRDPMDWLRVVHQGIRADPWAAVAVHGDFWPGNVFVGADSLQVVDFEGHGVGLQYEDVVHFLIHTELYLAYPFLGALRQRLSAAFLEGYLGGRSFDEALFRFCLTAAAARLLGRARGRAESGDLRPRHRRLLRARLVGD